MKKNKAFIAMIIAGLLSSISIQASEPSKPNFLYIVTDEHNFRTIGAYRNQLSDKQAHMWGETVVETPHLDYLANQGALFTSMYATSPSCTPSRASMFTGQYPQTVNMPKNGRVMSGEIPTLADVLAKNGYHTAYTGKLHLLGHDDPLWHPKENFGFQDNRFMFNGGHWKKLGFNPDGSGKVDSHNNKGKPSSQLANADEHSFATDWLTDRALDVFDASKKSGQPFFKVVSILDPHTPNTVRPPYNTMYKLKDIELPHTWNETFDRKQASWRLPEIDFAMKAKAADKNGIRKKLKAPHMPSDKIQLMLRENITQYFGMVKCIDDNVGKMIARLKANGQFDNTIIIFTADHGDLLGEHGRDNKGVPFEGSAKIPFIVYYPKAIPANTIVNKAANNTDLMDTVLSLMKIKNHDPSSTAGRDLTPWFSNQATSKGEALEDLTFVRYQTWVGAFTDRYKLIFEKGGKKPWLIDLNKDPDENINYFDDPAYRQIRSELAHKLQAYAKAQNDDIALDAKVQTQLTKLL